MNPIPLSAPDGAIYAYACGRCHHVSSSSSMLVVPDEPGPIAQLVESSLARATDCCICNHCDAPLTGDGRLGDCDECERSRAHAWTWQSIAYCMQRGITDRAGYTDARNRDWDEDSEDE